MQHQQSSRYVVEPVEKERNRQRVIDVSGMASVGAGVNSNQYSDTISE